MDDLLGSPSETVLSAEAATAATTKAARVRKSLIVIVLKKQQCKYKRNLLSLQGQHVQMRNHTSFLTQAVLIQV